MTSGVSMHAMTRNVAPHTPQCSMSMWKTRLSRWIQLIGAGRGAWGSRAVHDLPAVIDREAFVRERWAGDIAAKAFERVPLMGSAARAAMQRKPRELSDALRERVGRDGAQGQGLAPGMGADCDAIVDDGAEELLETVGGFEVEGGCERAPGRALGKARPNRNGAADDSPIKPAADAPRTRRLSRASPRRRPAPRTPRSARSLRAPPSSSARRPCRTAPGTRPEARAGRRRR